MELQNPSNGDPPSSELADPSHGEHHLDPPLYPPDDVDSSCSTPYVSAPSSPGRGGVTGGYFFSAPTSPMHFVLSSNAGGGGGFPPDSPDASVAGSFEFEFSARFPFSATSAAGSMTSADELFLNGQIRPMKLSSHLQRPQVLAPLLDLNEEEDDDDESERHLPEMAARGRDLKLRSRSIRRRARSHSPLRNAPLHWQVEVEEREDRAKDVEPVPDLKQLEAEAATPSVSVSSSRSSSTSSSSSSSSGRTSKKWIFLKDLLYRSKSEGRERGNTKEKFWHSISFSQSKSKSKPPPPTPPPCASTAASTPSSSSNSEAEKGKSKDPPPSSGGSSKRTAAKPVNGVGRRRVPAPSPHERHYTANRAQAEEMRRKTFLPYRQGLLGCLGFSSRSYGAINGFARSLHPVSSG
ncbi:uncharacterized protein [Elaeis guineensis]|uniref:Uncharacterized protein LOC105052576 n=1 Tax=Elaeis guineensis var. tenera TaxID=51953 RepID=A0A6I9RT76_ELAGV|nr:uncharacterized protein LOC105052576 [Elaeis guineensis]